MKELFAEFGGLKKAEVHYDRDGRSLGTAEMMFESRASALKAKRTYNDVPLDGRRMQIEFVGDRPAPQRVARSDSFPRRNSGARSVGRRGGPPRAGGQRGGRPQREKKEEMTAEQLDKQLDDYLVSADKE